MKTKALLVIASALTVAAHGAALFAGLWGARANAYED